MSFRAGSDNPRSGPRLPRPSGPFCAICQDHEKPGNRVIPGLWAYLRFSMDLAVCERCIRDHMPRYDPDPRQVTLDDVA